MATKAEIAEGLAKFQRELDSPTFQRELKKVLAVPEQHRLKIARDSMKTPCPMLGVMGGPNHFEAAGIIHELTGVFVNIEADCTCKRGT